MHDSIETFQHDHSFGQDVKRPGEWRTILVIGITATMMIVEIVAGLVYGSMALLADGLHMASHAAALSISAFAYIYARRHAHDTRYSFGTGKVNSLGGFTGAVLLAVFAVMMAWESLQRIIFPVDIAFDQAIFVAFIGLIVNGASVFILGVKDDHSHGGNTGQHDTKNRDRSVDHSHRHHHHDHNLKAAYLHVLADTLTSLLAIVALFAGKYFGALWMDPMMGIVGAALVSRWSMGLLHATSIVLLDRQAPKYVLDAIRQGIECDDDRLADIHVWCIGPNIYAAELVVVTDTQQSAGHYKARIPKELGIVHVNVEIKAGRRGQVLGT